jgi:NO-binding membrane sensor protein with MHYT domain
MATVQQFANGAINPVAGYLVACTGSLIGLGAAKQAHDTQDRGRRTRWLVISSASIGVAFWLMHFVAMLGFDVPDSTVRYEPGLTAFSAVMAVLVVGAGIFTAGYGPPSAVRVVRGGLVTGAGVAAMTYTGTAAMRVGGSVGYGAPLVAASVLVAVVAATAALWCATNVRGWWPRVAAAAALGVAVTGTHYTALAALRVHLQHDSGPVGGGVDLIGLVPLVIVIATGALLALVFIALQTAAQEEFERRGPAWRASFVHIGEIQPRDCGVPPAIAAAPDAPHLFDGSLRLRRIPDYERGRQYHRRIDLLSGAQAE